MKNDYDNILNDIKNDFLLNILTFFLLKKWEKNIEKFWIQLKIEQIIL